MRMLVRGGNPSQEMNKTNKPKNTKQTLSRLMRFLKPYSAQVLLVSILIMFTSLANVVGTYLLQPIIDGIINNTSAVVPSNFATVVLYMGLIYAFGTACNFGQSRLMVNISAKVLNDMRKQVFCHMQKLPISYFDKRTHGEIMSTYTNDVESMRELITRAMPQFIQSLTTIVGFAVAMALLNWMLIGICIMQIVVNVLIVMVIGKRSKKYYRAQQKGLAELNGIIEETIEGQKVVKVFSHEQFVKEKFDEKNDNLEKSAVKANACAMILGPINNNVGHLFYALTVVLGAIMVFGQVPIWGVAFSIGSLITFLEYSRRFHMPIANLSQQFTSIFHALAGAERVFDLLDQNEEINNGKTILVNAEIADDGILIESTQRTGIWAWKATDIDGATHLTRLEGDVVFDNVTFSYDGDKKVLKNVSLYAHKGQKIALVGSTGAGKTTITNLINRFYEIQEGQILYDGISIEKIEKNSLRRSLSMVLQDTRLFTGTVMDNIRYGKLDATDEECIAAAKLSNAHFFISHLPMGYQTLLTSDGANLSQGQRQLLAIARAAVADPPVLILDEATSSIDTRTEKLIEKGMDTLMEGRTVFVIAHRLSTVRNADAIMVLEKGAIIERGNHNSLLAQKGKYYELYTGMLELD